MAAAAAAPREGSPKACKAKTVQAARKQYDYSTLTYDNHEEIVRNSLFVLPYSVVIDVLSQWISILDLCRFDTALCNKFLRFEYYETNDVLFSNQFLMDGRIPRVVGNGAGGTSADDYSYNRAEIDRIPNISTRKASGEDDTYTHHVKSAGFGATKAIAAGVMDGKSNSLDRSDVLPENREIKEHISHWECPRKISYYLWLYMRQIRVQHLEIHLDYCKDTRLDQLSSVRMHAKFANSHGGGSCSSGSAIIRTNNTDNLPSTPASLDSSGNSCANTPSSVISPASSLTASASPVKVDSYVRDQNSEAPLVQETAAAEHIQEEPCTILSPSTYYSAPQRSYYSECIPRFRDDNITKDLNKDINNGRVSRMIQNIDFSALLYLKILPQRKAFSLEVLESIFRSCDLLSVLDITDCKFPFKFLLGYPSHVPLLKKLIAVSVYEDHRGCIECLQSLATHCRYLKQVDISRCGLGDHAFHTLFGNIADHLEANRTNSTQSTTAQRDSFLHLIDSTILSNRQYYNEINSNEAIQMQIQLDPYWNYLQVLNISKNLYLTDSGLVTIAKRLGNTLEEIDISNCCIVTDEGVVEFSKNCKKLRAVKLSSVRITNASLVAFSRFNHETLTSVDFSLCEDITDDGMIALIFAINENLKYININECLLLTDETLMNISDYCINIQSLDLKSPYITTYGIAKLLKYTFAVNICGQFGQLIPLPSVMLRGKYPLGRRVGIVIPRISDADIINLSVNASHIRAMDISLYGNNRTALSDLSISAISKHCTSLFLLRIENSLRITDDAILQLLSLRCPKLQVLYLKNCIEITNRVVDSFSKYLHTYYVIDCPQVHGSRRSKKHVLLSKQKSEVNEPNSDNCYNCETTVKSANSERRTNNWMANYDDSYENNLVGDSLRSRFGSSGRNNYYESSNSDIIPDYALDDEYVTLYTTGIHKNVRNGSDFYLTKFEIFFTIMMLATSIVGTAFVFVLVVVGEDKILNRAQQISGRGSVSNSITTFLQTTLITVLLLAVLLTSSMAFQTLNKSK